MGDSLAQNRVVDRRGLDPAQTDISAGHRRNRPWEAPAVAVEHRQCPQIDRMMPRAPDEDIAERVQICTTVVIHDSLWVAGRARGVIESDRVPFIFGRNFREVRIASREKRFVLHLAEPFAAGSAWIGDIDHGGRLVELRQRAPDHRRKFGVGNQHFRFAMAQDESDRIGIEADIQRIQNRPRHRHPEMRLEGFRDVWRHQRDRVTPPDPACGQRRREPAAAFECLAPAVSPLAMHDGEAIWIHRCTPRQKPDRAQRHVVRRVLVEPHFVRVGVAGCHTDILPEENILP